MLPISEFKVIENAFFRSDLKYNKSSLYPFLAKSFSEDVLFCNSRFKKIDSIIERLSSDLLAHNVLLKLDLSKIKNNISNDCSFFEDRLWIDRLPEIHNKITKYLNLNFEKRDILFCDSFPNNYKNFEQRGASAITVFERKQDSGIHYLNKRVDNVSTAIHIIHEQIHTCLSQNKDSDQFFIEWFEEGICIIYSLLIYYELTEDMKTLNAYKERSFIFSKVKPEWDFTKRYFEYMKIMSTIFLSGGFEIINNLLSHYIDKDREFINSYLKKIKSNSLPIKYIPKNEIENFIALFFNVLEPEQITPLEYFIVESLNTPKNIKELSEDVSAPENIIKNTLGRLFGKGICMMSKDNKIDVVWRKKDLFNQGLIKPIFPLN